MGEFINTIANKIDPNSLALLAMAFLFLKFYKRNGDDDKDS